MRTIDTMMGKCYPFFLENSVLSKSPYYLYELYSPCLSDKGVPTFSMRKLSEKVLDVHPKTGEYLYPIGKESDLLYYVANTKKVKKTFLEYMKGVYRNPEVFVSEYCGKSGFPITELNLSDNFNTLQRQLIISLRDSLRWKSYKFAPGRQVDLLYSPTEFVVCAILLSKSFFIFSKTSSSETTKCSGLFPNIWATAPKPSLADTFSSYPLFPSFTKSSP